MLRKDYDPESRRRIDGTEKSYSCVTEFWAYGKIDDFKDIIAGLVQKNHHERIEWEIWGGYLTDIIADVEGEI